MDRFDTLGGDRALAADTGGARAGTAQPPEASPGVVALFQTVQALRVSDAPFVLQFIAPHAKAGTSLVAAGFAQSAAGAADGRVLLVDASMGEDGMYSDNAVPLMGQPDGGFKPAMFRLDHGCRNLYRARLAPRLSPGLAISPDEVMRCFIGLRDRFAIIVLDCASLDVLPQAAMLGRYADGTALVVQAEATERDEVLAARRTIELMGGQLIGAVFNRARDFKPLAQTLREAAGGLAPKLTGRPLSGRPGRR
jgi:hypothetical protein